MASNYKEKRFTDLLQGHGLNLAGIIDSLEGQLAENRENFLVIRGLLDNKTTLTERIKLLELELFIEVLKRL